MQIMQSAIENGATAESLQKLLDLQERYDANNARKAYNKALVAAQSEMPTVFKGREAKNSKYASFDDIMRVIRPVLDAHGLAVSFAQSEDEKTLTITCKILHAQGHSEETPFTLPKDGPLLTKDGRQVTNLAQAQGSANSYAKRYCLTNALNIVLGDQDDDARALDQPLKAITEPQAIELQDLLDQSGVEEDKFLTHFHTNTIAEFPLVSFARAKSMLEQRILTNTAK